MRLVWYSLIIVLFVAVGWAFSATQNIGLDSSSGGGGGTWGSITGTLSNQTDLQTELDAKFDGADYLPLTDTLTVSTSDPGTCTVAEKGKWWAKTDASGANLGTWQCLCDSSDTCAYVSKEAELGAVINALTAKTTPVVADSLAISDSEASNVGKKITIENFYKTIAGLTAKTTPVDADLVSISDSAASNAGKKSTLRQVFDNIYAKLVLSGSNPTVNTTGQIAIDTTGPQLLWYDGTAVRTSSPGGKVRFCFKDESPSDSNDDKYAWVFPAAATVTNFGCKCRSGTIALTVGDGTNSFEAVTCGNNTWVTDDGSITNATFTANESIEYDSASNSSCTAWVACVDFVYDRQ